MAIGCDSPLYVLRFGHRATFSKARFGREWRLSPKQTEQIAAIKEAIHHDVKPAVAGGLWQRCRSGVDWGMRP